MLLLPFVFCYPSSTVSAQEEVQMKEIISPLAEGFTEEEDLSEFTEKLSFHLKYPLNLNKISSEQLKELFFLSPLQISSFFTHLRTNGKLKDVLELQSVDGFDVTTIARLMPFVTIQEAGELNLARIRTGTSEFTWRYGQLLEEQKGYKILPGSRYLGSPAKILFKYRYVLPDQLSLSIVVKKDAGEILFNNKSGFDFISGSLAFYKPGRLKKIIAGDYSLQFGQGLSLWSGSSFGKGDDVAGIAKKDTGLKPYTSANEYSFFRGIGAKYSLLKNIDLTPFISYRSLDAALTKKDDGTERLSAINTSGLHRTATEAEHKGNLGLLLYGLAVTYHKQRLDLGLTAYHSSYQHEFTTGNQRYKKYSFSGKELTNFGFHYNYTFKNIYWFGELAQSIPGGMALVNGAMASLSPSISTVLLFRDYAKEHVSFYNKATGEGTTAANEKGIYAGIHISPSRKWTISVYGDLFWFPWAKYRIDEASSGYEFRGSLSFKPDKTFKTILSCRIKHSEQNESTGQPINPTIDVRKDNYRLEVHWKPLKKIELQNRFEFTAYEKGLNTPEYGYMIYQDVNYQPMSSRLSGNFRFAFFRTTSYNSRIYAYEDDVLHGAGSGIYSDKGIRTFLNLSYRLSRHLRIWGRYAVYLYPGKTNTGSGLEEISGNKRSDIKFQIRYQF
ncbi:helix-hairpin-helix domain-containing protein [Pedobacter sp. PAMC26386]|nr:helix-hairpin-helix domain-containing protein [Pedobacter sp. PAMC26386]